MPGLFLTLGMAARSLEAMRFGLDVAGNNIANMHTEGYTRRTLQLAEVVNHPGGVEVTGIRAERDVLIEARLRRHHPAEAHDGAVADALAVVEAAIGDPGQSLDARFNALFDAFASLAHEPTSAVARDNVLLQARQLTQTFHDLTAAFEDSTRAADFQIRDGVAEVNRLTAEIAALNEEIGNTGGDTNTLQDRREVAVQALARLVPVSAIPGVDGSLNVSLTSGRALVTGDESYLLGTVATPPSGLLAVTSGGVDITGEISSGRVGGAIHVRDQILPEYQQRLDELAYELATELNTLHAAGYDMAGVTGRNFFAPPAALAGAAANLAIDATVAADSNRIAASQTGAVGDNQTASAISALRDQRITAGGTSTLHDSWGQLLYRVGSQAQTARTQQQNRQDVVDQIVRLREQISGVSLDEEAAMLMKFQRAFEANARFFTVVDQTLLTLMGIVGRL
jgi:flagellar hook-associated protein 1 FlgK